MFFEPIASEQLLYFTQRKKSSSIILRSSREMPASGIRPVNIKIAQRAATGNAGEGKSKGHDSEIP